MKEYRDESPVTEDDIWIDTDNEEDYNTHLDDLAKFGEGKFKFAGVSNKPHELVIEDDPRTKYKKFDEKYLEGGESEDDKT